MTLKERHFEEFGNEQQATKDELNDLKEWRRLKDYEEEAVALYHDLGENLEEYTAQMRTRDQMEMEFQCGRNKQIDKDLSVNAQRALAAARSIPYAMEQERIKVTREKVQADFKAGVESSMANTKISTNATGSQQASKQSEVTRSKPEKHDSTSQLVSSTEAGSPRQQETTKPNLRGTHDQLRSQAPDQSQSASATIGQSNCSGTSVGVGSSKQQEKKKQPSAEEIRRQFVEQGRNKAAEAGLSGHKERKIELSPEGVCSNSQARVQAQPAALTGMPTTTTTNVRTVPPQSAASAPLKRLRDGDIFLRPYNYGPIAAESQQRTRVNSGVHHPEDGVLVRKEPGLTKFYLGCSSYAEQSLAHNTHQAPDTSRGNPVIRSTEHSPRRTSPHHSSNSTSPDKSSDSTSPDESSDSTSPEKSPNSTPPYQAPDANYKPPSPADPSPPRKPVPQTVPVVSSFNTRNVGNEFKNGDQYEPPNNSRPLLKFEWVPYRCAISRLLGNKDRPSSWNDPPINGMFGRAREDDMQLDSLVRMQKFEERQKLRRSVCSQGGTSQQERTERERKKKLACEQKWKELDELCRKTCSQGGKPQQKDMSQQELEELCRKTYSQGGTSQQKESQNSNLTSDLKRRLDRLCEDIDGISHLE